MTTVDQEGFYLGEGVEVGIKRICGVHWDQELAWMEQIALKMGEWCGTKLPRVMMTRFFFKNECVHDLMHG